MTSQHDQELEARTNEYEGLPAHILGLDGWLLRSIPESRRKEFLQGYERLLKVVFHPDRYPAEEEKIRKQKYLQAVSNAVFFLTNDPIAFEMSVDKVGTAINPIVSLRRTLETREKQLGDLEKQLSSLTAEKSKVQELYATAQKELRILREENDGLKKVARATAKIGTLKTGVGYSLNYSYIVLNGREVLFEENKVTDLMSWLSSRDVESMSQEDYKRDCKEFSRLMKDNHVKGEEKQLRFTYGSHRISDRTTLKLVAGLSLAELLKYIMIQRVEDREINEISSIHQSMQNKHISHLLSRFFFTDERVIGGITNDVLYRSEYYDRIGGCRERQIEVGGLAILLKRTLIPMNTSVSSTDKLIKKEPIRYLRSQKDEFSVFYVEGVKVGSPRDAKIVKPPRKSPKKILPTG